MDLALPENEIFLSVAGITADQNYGENVRKALSGCSHVSQLVIETQPEPNNPYDSRAIQIKLNGLPIGYVPRKEQSVLDYRCPDIFLRPKTGKVQEIGFIYGASGNFVYCNISLAI